MQSHAKIFKTDNTDELFIPKNLNVNEDYEGSYYQLLAFINLYNMTAQEKLSLGEIERLDQKHIIAIKRHLSRAFHPDKQKDASLKGESQLKCINACCDYLTDACDKNYGYISPESPYAVPPPSKSTTTQQKRRKEKYGSEISSQRDMAHAKSQTLTLEAQYNLLNNLILKSAFTILPSSKAKRKEAVTIIQQIFGFSFAIHLFQFISEDKSKYNIVFNNFTTSINSYLSAEPFSDEDKNIIDNMVENFILFLKRTPRYLLSSEQMIECNKLYLVISSKTCKYHFSDIFPLYYQDIQNFKKYAISQQYIIVDMLIADFDVEKSLVFRTKAPWILYHVLRSEIKLMEDIYKDVTRIHYIINNFILRINNYSPVDELACHAINMMVDSFLTFMKYQRTLSPAFVLSAEQCDNIRLMHFRVSENQAQSFAAQFSFLARIPDNLITADDKKRSAPEVNSPTLDLSFKKQRTEIPTNSKWGNPVNLFPLPRLTPEVAKPLLSTPSLQSKR